MAEYNIYHVITSLSGTRNLIPANVNWKDVAIKFLRIRLENYLPNSGNKVSVGAD